MKTVNTESGFSLVELMLAAVITVGLIGGVFALMNRNQKLFFTESTVTDMNSNMRTAVDLLTRDVQAAGMGLSRQNGSFAAIFYVSNTAVPDSLLILNGDPYAPTADVDEFTTSSPEIFCEKPADLMGSSGSFTYLGDDGTAKPFYRSYSSAPRQYLIYDDKRARFFPLTGNGVYATVDGVQKLKLTYDTSKLKSPAGIFGSAIDTDVPNLESNAKIAVVGSMIGYRVNRITRELERTEDLDKWYPVARGILDMQIEYRTSNSSTSTIAPSDRRAIRAVVINITAETPDLYPTDKNYRISTHRFETTPRNFNLLRNTNLSSNQ